MFDQSIFLVYLASLVVAVALVAKFVRAIFSERNFPPQVRHPIVLLIQLLFVVGVWFAPWGAALGYFAASHDLAKGHFYIKKIGLIREPSRIYERLLKDRYNIHCLSGAGCMPKPAEIDFAVAYNAISRAAIRKHFGRDVLAECRRDAQDEFYGKQ